MTNNYEYIQVDPKVIQMLGGSDDMQESIAGEFGGDLPRSAVESYGRKSSSKKNMFEDLENEPIMAIPSTDSVPSLLQEILNELREIKIILAGRE